jgi:hypothetical protein
MDVHPVKRTRKRSKVMRLVLVLAMGLAASQVNVFLKKHAFRPLAVNFGEEFTHFRYKP